MYIIIYCYNIFMHFYYILVDYGMAIIPEDRIVAIHRASNRNEDEEPISRIQRALPPPREESMALAIESSSSPNSMFLKVSSDC